ncbi:MAG: DUF1559 domain-containing protein [Planctomycetaceae bacterium]|nr:DUF1559 domain-containing protein [Planctomycetaceae bacterium]
MWGRYGFGSSHAGVVNFLVCDGSVHSLSVKFLMNCLTSFRVFSRVSC